MPETTIETRFPGLSTPTALVASVTSVEPRVDLYVEFVTAGEWRVCCSDGTIRLPIWAHGKIASFERAVYLGQKCLQYVVDDLVDRAWIHQHDGIPSANRR